MKRRTYRRPRRKRIYRRKRQLRIARPLRRPRVYSYKQYCERGTITLSTTSLNTFFAYTFKFEDLDQATTLASLYDQYRICAVKIEFYPPYNVSYVTPSSQSFECPQIYTVIDKDTQTAPTSLGQINQYQTLRRQYFNRRHSRYLKPNLINYATLTSQTGTYAYSQASRKQWVDCGSSSALYYGLLGAIVFSGQQQIIPGGVVVRVSCTYYIQFKNVR